MQSYINWRTLHLPFRPTTLVCKPIALRLKSCSYSATILRCSAIFLLWRQRISYFFGMETAVNNLIFSNARAWRTSRHMLFWAAWTIFLSWAYGAKMANETTRTIAGVNAAYMLGWTESLVYLPCQLVLTYTLLYGLILRYLLHRKYGMFVLGTLAAFVVVGAMSLPITIYLATPLRTAFGFAPVWNTVFSSLMTSLRGGSAILGFAIGLKLLKLWYEKQRDNQILIQKNLEAELSSLKAQIHPHFLFNTLNSLYALTLQASPDAPEAVLRLSAMLRTMLYDCTGERIPLHTELDLIRNYIELERLRFGDRVDISLAWNNADSEGFAIAPLVLLPFVENAFKHGVSTTNDTAWISLETSIQAEELTFRLSNSKPEEYFPQAHHQSTRAIPSGLGLANVRKRLSLLYGDRFTLHTSDEGETFVVVLSLPLGQLHLGQLHSSAPPYTDIFHEQLEEHIQ